MPGPGAGRRSGVQYARFLQPPRGWGDAVGPPPTAAAPPPPPALSSAPPAGTAALPAPPPFIARLHQLQLGIPLLLDGLLTSLASASASTSNFTAPFQGGTAAGDPTRTSSSSAGNYDQGTGTPTTNAFN